MKRLRVSSAFNLHGIPSGDFAAFVEAGLRFYREKGFDTVDFDLTLLNLDGEGWKEETEAALAACEKHGLRFEIGHLPFTGGETQGEEMEAFCERMHRAIDAAALLGLGYAVMHPNTSTLPMARYDRAAQHEKVMRHLAPFVEHADRVGLKTVVENPANKYVLLDFWASWCGPCMAEVPHLKEAYDAYKAKGFEIFGVSLDNNGEAWWKAVEEKGLNWLHVSDLKGWQNAAAADYAVRSIPSNYLIDCATGTIVAVNLRGEEVKAKLAELLD